MSRWQVTEPYRGDSSFRYGNLLWLKWNFPDCCSALPDPVLLDNGHSLIVATLASAVGVPEQWDNPQGGHTSCPDCPPKPQGRIPWVHLPSHTSCVAVTRLGQKGHILPLCVSPHCPQPADNQGTFTVQQNSPTQPSYPGSAAHPEPQGLRLRMVPAGPSASRDADDSHKEAKCCGFQEVHQKMKQTSELPRERGQLKGRGRPRRVCARGPGAQEGELGLAQCWHHRLSGTTHT